MTTTARRSSLDRIPPNNLQAEMACIGSVLVDREIMATVAGHVRSSDFYAHVHETIFEALLDLFERGEPLDKITVAEALRKRGALERVGGISYLNALMDTVQTAASARYYATIVREKAVLRSLIHAGTQIAELGFEGEEDVNGALDIASQMVLALATRDIAESSSAHDIARELVDEMYAGIRRGLSTGFSELDRLIRGLNPERLYYFGARPGVGKTSFLLAVARRIAQEGHHVHIASAEMSKTDLMKRLLAAELRLDFRQLDTWELSERERDASSRALGFLADLPITIDDNVGTIEEVVASARRHHAKRKIDMLAVDYVQMLGSNNVHRDANTNERVTYISRRLKLLSKELHVPVVALTQLNRELEKRQDKRPQLSDLRESGSLEQDADFVGFLYREGMYDENADHSAAEVLVRKNRYGPLDTAHLRWVESCMRFQDIE